MRKTTMPLEAGTVYPGDYRSRLDGDDGELWEPVWRLRTPLLPVERHLLASPPLRRLHFLHLSGPAYLHTHHTYSRLQLTLGVFALIAHLCPDDVYLRVAALLHDVGHAPFSHTLEHLAGVDHHHWTRERVSAPPIVDILHTYHLEPEHVLAYIAGYPANLLRNDTGIIHVDHLDAWVRNAHVVGALSISAPEILRQLRVRASFLEMNAATALLILQLVLREARLHCSAASLGTQTILMHLVQRLLDAEVLTVARLADMTDGMLEHLLLTTPTTADEAWRLWYQPDQLVVQPLRDEPPPGAHLVPVEKLYVSQPLVGGQPATHVVPEAADVLTAARQFLGTYVVYWSK
jgi:uncharacterized protein